jgi:hypothetical protein
METLDLRAEFGYSVPEFPGFSAPVCIHLARLPCPTSVHFSAAIARGEPANSITKQPIRSERLPMRRDASCATAKARMRPG